MAEVIFSVPPDFIIACRLSCFHQRSYFLSEGVENRQSNHACFGQLITNGGAGVKRIRIVLKECEVAGHGRMVIHGGNGIGGQFRKEHRMRLYQNRVCGTRRYAFLLQYHVERITAVIVGCRRLAFEPEQPSIGVVESRQIQAAKNRLGFRTVGHGDEQCIPTNRAPGSGVDEWQILIIGQFGRRLDLHR